MAVALPGLDATELTLVDFLHQVPALAAAEHWSNAAIWTRQLSRRLCALGGAAGCFVCASGLEPEAWQNSGEWLWDVAWLRYDPWPQQPHSRLIEVRLVVECEWSRATEEIYNDFEKLIAARASHRLMIFEDHGTHQAIFETMKARVAAFQSSKVGDRYLLAAWSEALDHFILDHYVHAPTLVQIGFARAQLGQHPKPSPRGPLVAYGHGRPVFRPWNADPRQPWRPRDPLHNLDSILRRPGDLDRPPAERSSDFKGLLYTAADNLRSQAVMVRLHMIRDTSRDFTVHGTRTCTWRGLVWSATPDLFRLGREDAG